MKLIEVRENLLKQEKGDIRKRFFQDTSAKLTLYIWQNRIAEAGNNIERYQISYKDSIFEWSPEKGLRYGKLDEGDNPMGMKRSPVMYMSAELNQTALARLVNYFMHAEDKYDHELDFVITSLTSYASGS